MASIGEDIKSVLEELGTPLTIYKFDGTVIDGEFIDSEGYPDHSTLFTRMFMKHGSVSFDTQIEIGDIVYYGGEYHIVTNKVGSLFEGSLIEYEIVTYITNVVGSFYRYNDNPNYDLDYKATDPWALTTENVKGCQVEKKLAEDLADHAHILAVADINNILYVSADCDIKTADRFILASGDRYKVESVSKLEINGVSIVKLGDDDRA